IRLLTPSLDERERVNRMIHRTRRQTEERLRGDIVKRLRDPVKGAALLSELKEVTATPETFRRALDVLSALAAGDGWALAGYQQGEVDDRTAGTLILAAREQLKELARLSQEPKGEK